jgi:hypothetical protein
MRSLPSSSFFTIDYFVSIYYALANSGCDAKGYSAAKLLLTTPFSISEIEITFARRCEESFGVVNARDDDLPPHHRGLQQKSRMETPPQRLHMRIQLALRQNLEVLASPTLLKGT